MLPLPLVLPSTVGLAELPLMLKWGTQLLLFEVVLTWGMAGMLWTGATVLLDVALPMEWLPNLKFVVFVPENTVA